MPGPVVIDDGGSIRIKLFDGNLDKLIEVEEIQDPGDKHHESKDSAIGPFQRIKVLCVDKTGLPFEPAPGGSPFNMGDGNGFEIYSGKLRIIGKMVGTNCEITVKGTAGIEPSVETRCTKKQHRHIVSNAPAIERVVIIGADYNADFKIEGYNPIYTVVVLE